MSFLRGIAASLALATLLCGGDAGMSQSFNRQVSTVAVDARTGKLVRVPVRRPARTARAVPQKAVSPARPVAARPATSRSEAAVAEGVTAGSERAPEATDQAAYNVVAHRPLDALVTQVAERYQVAPSFVHAVIQAESNYNPRAVSPKGALGLMQLMPQTARRFGVANVFSPEQNVEGGVRYLRYLLDLYHRDPRQWTLSLAAYNAGEGAVEHFGGVPPYSETQQYLRRVNRLWERFENAEPWTPAPAPKKLGGPRIIETVDDAGILHFTTELQ